MDMDNNNPNIIGLDLPLKDSKGLAGLFLRYYSTLGALICDTRESTDFRVNMFVTLMINSIPEDDVRDKLKRLRKELLNEIPKDMRDVEDRNRAILNADMELVGEIAGYVDQYLGTSKKISVSVEACYPECEIPED